MKKTLIALMALASVACATTNYDFNATLDKLTQDWTGGTAYELTFTVDTHDFNGYISDAILTLGSNYHVMSQAGQYIGVSTKNNGLSNGTSDPGPNKSGSFNDSTTLYTIESESPVYGWVSVNSGKGSAAYGVGGMTVTVGYDGADTSILLDFDGASEIDTMITLKGQEISAAGIELGGHITGVTNATLTYGGSSYVVPEPATATLSLLALAGLCARRRRA